MPRDWLRLQPNFMCYNQCEPKGMAAWIVLRSRTRETLNLVLAALEGFFDLVEE